METKHAFLFSFILGVLWSGYLFGYANSVDPGVNGFFGASQTCAQFGCHVGFPVNTVGGNVTVSGLPAAWTPGTTYALTVRVQRTGQRVFGFQLSAVADTSNEQAGTFAGGSGVQIICGSAIGFRVNCTSAGAIQFVEHVLPSTTGTFNVNWTAPSTAVTGTVRFNMAANAANGDGSKSGDFIYAEIYTVDPVETTANPVRSFSLIDRGGVSMITDGAGATPDVGYTRIQPGPGSTTPAGVAIFGSRTNGILVSETGVPASPALTSGRFYAEVAGAVNTGLAIANPNNSIASITFFLTDAAGNDLGFGSTTIPANGQITKFLNEPPFNSGSSFQGTFSFTSTLPVGVVALRSYINEHADFLMSTLPVIDTSVRSSTGTIILPYFADGGGWMTQILLVNPTDTAMTGVVLFTKDNGDATNVTIGGKTANAFTYSVPRRSSQKLATTGFVSVTTAGTVRVVPTDGGVVPTALVLFSYKPLGVVISEAGVPTLSGTAFRMYAESSGTDGQAGNIQTGIAVANNTSSAANVTFELTNLDGSTTGLPVATTVSVPASGNIAKFLAQIFPSVPNPFKGVLRISTNASGISVVGLRARYNERVSAENFIITTTPPMLETAAATAAESFFPELANGGGYTTQFILFSGTAGQSSSGNLRFVKSDGSGFSLNLN